MSDACCNAALEYLDAGFSVIPVQKIGKRPYLDSWKEFQQRRPSYDEVCAWWERWPDANVAIITGSISGIWMADADGKDGEYWIDEHLPRTTAYSKTYKGVHALYRIPDGVTIRNRTRLAPQVDIRGEGGYFVAPPSVHETGHVYRWIFMETHQGWDSLPLVAPGANGNGNGQGNLSLNLGDTKGPLSKAPVAQGERNSTLARLAGLWAAKGLDADEIMVLALAWNKNCSPPLGESEVRKTIDSIYGKHSAAHPRISLSAVAAPTVTPESVIPEAILHPGGLLQDVMAWIQDASPTAFPLFNLGAALTMLGTLVGQKVMTETGLRTNLYVISLSYSGAGKGAPLSGVSTLMGHAGADMLMGPNHLTSGPAILSQLAIQPRQVMLVDEIGELLAGMKNPQSPYAEIPRILKALFSSTDRSETKKYRDTRNNIYIKWHHLSLYGTGTPGRFWEGLTFGDVTDGFLARVIILESHHEALMPQEPRSTSPAPALITAIADLHKFEPALDGNIGRPRPLVIPKTDEAKNWFAAWADRWFGLRNELRKEEDGRAAIYGRAAEHAHKLALLHAVSRVGAGVYDGETSVDLSDVQWAAGVIDYVIPEMVAKVVTNISVNETDQWRQKILKAICRLATPKRPGASKRELIRHVRGLTYRTVDEILLTMEQAGEIGQLPYQPENASGRPCILFVPLEQTND